MRNKVTFHIITLFPESIEGYFGSSIMKRAIEDNKIKIKFYDIKDFTLKGERADRKPYAGGPGMVIKAEPVIKAVAKAIGTKRNVKTIMFSPRGKEFSNSYAKKLANNYKDIVLIAGHYEGIDARAKKILKAENISIGPYVLTGGELPAAVVVDAIGRQIEGVLGNFDSIEEKRISVSEVYTRPEIIKYKNKNYKVPKVLLSGHHEKIEDWKLKKGKIKKSK